MKFAYPFILLAVALGSLTACHKDDNKEEEKEKDKPISPSTGKPVETLPANTTYKPAFEGQTRINGVKTSVALQTTVVTSALTAPWGIVSLPDGRLLITEKAGKMRIVTTSGTVGNAITTGIPAVNAGSQGGLLGLCIDPQFASNRMIYWAFSENVTGGTVTAVAKGRLADNEASIENTTVIYRATPAYNGTLHYGGRVIFDKTGNLMVSIGERSDLATRPLAQSVTASLGKVIRITTSGAAAPGNPTFSQSGALPELYSMGHRNPQGLALHPTTGEVWQSEHGPRGGDEINRLKAGANFGWPTITYGIEYSGAAIGNPPIQQQNGLEQPMYYWDPVISPSGMTFYKGDRIPEWENDLFIGALSGQHIARLLIINNKVAGEERILEGQGQRFRDLTQGKDSALYAITDAGRLYRIDKQ